MSLPNLPPPAGRVRAVLRGMMWAAVLGYFAFGGVVLGLRYLVLPYVDDYRGKIEDVASASVGHPVRIGGLRADWSGLRPRLHLQQLVIADDAGEPALELAQVDAVLGWSSLLRWRPYFYRIEMQGPRLVARRDVDGRVYVAGVVVDTQSTEPGFADWLLAQGSIVIRDARLEWTDYQRGAPTLVLAQVNFALDNWLGHHRFGLQARPPANLAAAIDLRGDLKGHHPERPADWRGQVYARVDEADLDSLGTWADLPFEAAGRGSARAWGELAGGHLTELTADLRLAEARARLAPNLPTLDLGAVTGRVHVAETAEQLSVELAGLSLATRDGVVIPVTDLRLVQHFGAKPGGSFHANQLDLGGLARLAAHLPLAQGVADQLVAFAPAGRIRTPELSWTGPPDSFTTWKAKGSFDGIAVRAANGIPGVSGLSGEVEGSEKEGRMRINSRGVVMDLPEVFPDPRLRLSSLRAEGGWKRHGGALEFSLDKAEFENQDASGEAAGTYHPTDTGPGVVDLQARLIRANGTAVWRYMPLSVNRDTREWLQRSITAGTALDVRLRLKGDLNDFPFADGKRGQFQVRARIAGARLDYAPGWPAIDGIDGELLFEGSAMKISAERGRIFGVQLAGVTAVLPDLDARDQVMTIKGRAAGPTRDFLRFITASPVAAQIGHATDDMSAEGNGNLDLELVMPLLHANDTGVKGEYRFDANRLGVVPQLPPVTEAGGRIAFSGSTLAVQDVRGKFFGEPVQVSGRTRGDGTLLFEASGGITPVAARQTWESPVFAHLSGLAAWRSAIQVRGRAVTVAVESNLKGLASSLPLPFNKSATDEWPLRVDLELQPGDATDHIRASLGKVAALEVYGRDAPDGWRATRGAMAIGQALKLPEKGLSLAISAPDLDVDAWRRISRQVGLPPSPTPQRGGSLDLTDVSVQSAKVVAAGETLHDFNLQATARPDGWQGNLKSREAEGDFRWSSKDEGALTAHLSRLTMTGGKEEGIGPEELGESAKTDSLPALDVTVQQFVLRDKALGRLALQARNEGGAWHLDSVGLTSAEGAFSGKGVWVPGRDSRTDLDFKVDTSDVGRFLARLGFPGTVKGGKATLAGKVRWSGPPTTIDYPSLSGKMDLEATNGQFQKVNPGVGRLLGVLNLQALPRRITMDFRDVFSEGFAFDRISGSIDVKAGVMSTSDLEIRGPAARVKLIGSADVTRETQDLLVKVQPTISESVAVGAAVTLVNPVAGVVTYLAQKALSDPIEKLLSFDYRVTGQWQDPKVEKLGASPAAESAKN